MSFKLSTGNSVNTSSSASISSNADTTATVKVTVGAGITNGYVQSTGVVAKIYINGSHVSSQTVFGNGTYTTAGMHYVSASKTISKSASSKSIAWSVQYWQYTDGYEQSHKQTDSGSITISGITYYEPNAPSALNNVRESDNKNHLYWTAASITTTKPISAILIERSVDGGAWSQIASVNGTATSYNDTSTFADHSYQYRIRSQNSAGYSSYATSQISYNTPSAPTKVTASRLAETTVKLEIENHAKTAQWAQIQRSTNGSNWETLRDVSGSPVTETTDEPDGGEFYYRVRNGREAQDGDMIWSEWSPTSNKVVTICAPDVPTLVSPASGMVVNKADEMISFSWLHNPIDGSAQTVAELCYSTDNWETEETVQVYGEASFCEIDNVFDVNAVVAWKVRTKGVADDFSEWSIVRVFYVYQQPSVAFTQPTDDFIVENTPIRIELQYADASGTLANATLTVTDGMRIVYTRNMGTETACDILATEWLPENGMAYVLSVAVRSSSSLTASATREITTDFILPCPAGVHIENDAEMGRASLVVYVEEVEELEIPKSISVWRETEDGRVLLGERLQAGSAIVDTYAPLNSGYQYIVTSFADSGAANSMTFANIIDSLWWFVYYEGGTARAMWEPSGSRTPRRTKDELKERDGSEWPVLIQGKNKSYNVDFSGWVEEKKEADEFERMTLASGDKVYKGLKGEVFHCRAEADITDSYDYDDDSAEVKVSISRVRGGVL